MTVDEMIEKLTQLSNKGFGNAKVVNYCGKDWYSAVGDPEILNVKRTSFGDYVKDDDGNITVVDVS